MISIFWDHTLPITPIKSVEEKEIEQWDEWFTLVGLEKEWGKLKQACTDTKQSNSQLIEWARIIEMTRLGTIVENGQE